jgi:predicted transcriptional regulator
MRVLHVKVAEPVADMLDRARQTMDALDAGEAPEPYFGIGFESLEQMLDVFTPERWTLLDALSARGPTRAQDLARALRRDAPTVASDLALLSEWNLVEQDPEGVVRVPWDEVDFKLTLAQRAA